MFFWGGGAGEEGWERKEQGRNGAGSLGSGDWEDLVADALGWGTSTLRNPQLPRQLQKRSAALSLID